MSLLLLQEQMVKNRDVQTYQSCASMKGNRKIMLRVLAGIIFVMVVSSCATVRIDPSNRAEQVSVTFDKTIK